MNDKDELIKSYGEFSDECIRFDSLEEKDGRKHSQQNAILHALVKHPFSIEPFGELFLT